MFRITISRFRRANARMRTPARERSRAGKRAGPAKPTTVHPEANHPSLAPTMNRE
jgi:hypothetical protein